VTKLGSSIDLLTESTGNLGDVFLAQGRLGPARERTERYLSISREIGHRLGEAIALHNLGNLDWEEGLPSSAKGCRRP